MQVVIDIPEAIYKASQIIDVKYEDVIQMPLEVITNGVPLNEYCEQQCPCYPMESEDD